MGKSILDAPFAGETGVSPEQESADATLITELNRLVEIGLDGMDDWITEWKENDQFYAGQMWDPSEANKRASWRALPVVPMAFTAVETIHAVVTDQPPESFCYPRAGGSQETAEMIGSHLSALFDDLDIERKNSRMWRFGMIKGTGYWKVWWDPKKSKAGEIQADIVKPQNIVVDPFADCIDEARWVAERKRIPLSTILERYPKLHERLKRSTNGGSVGKDLWDAYESDRKNSVNASSVWIWEMWFIDSTMAEQDMQATEASDIKKSVKKYPNGRVVRFVDKVKLEDKKNPYKFEGSGKRWPYVKYDCIENIEEFYGTSIIGPIKQQSMEVNEMEAAIMDNIKGVGNPKTFAIAGAVDPDTYTNAPASLTEVEAEDINTAVKIQPGVPISPDVFKHLETKKDDINQTSGITDAITGAVQASQRPGSVKAAFEASMGRMREMIRMNNAAMQDVGEMMVDLMQQYYKAGRIIFLSNDEGTTDFEDPSIAPIIRQALADPKVQKELESPLREITIKEENPEFQPQVDQLVEGGAFDPEEAKLAIQAKGVLQFKNNIFEGRYKYRVAVHPMQARDKGALTADMIQVLQFAGEQAPALLPHVVETLDWPNRRAIIKDIRQMSQLRQQNAELQQQLEGLQTSAPSAPPAGAPV